MRVNLAKSGASSGRSCRRASASSSGLMVGSWAERVVVMSTAFSPGVKLISRMPVLITLGGKGDMGLNMMGYVLEEPEDIQKIEEMKARLTAAGLGWAEIENFSQDIALHEELYGEIKAFVNAGGNGLGLGSSEDSFMLKAGSGLLEPQTVEITAHSGLTERYLAKGLPTIHLLAVKKLCEENGIPFDPDGIPEIGTSGVYYRSKTP